MEDTFAVPKPIFDPSIGPYLTLFAIGFAVGVVGHIYRVKTLIIAGLLLIYGGILFLPLYDFLRGQG
jgi:hypothetical protein